MRGVRFQNSFPMRVEWFRRSQTSLRSRFMWYSCWNSEECGPKSQKCVSTLSSLLAFILTLSVILLSPSLFSCSFSTWMTGRKILSLHFFCCCYIHLVEQSKGKSHSGTSQQAYWSLQAEPVWGWPSGHRSRGWRRPRCPGGTAESLPSWCMAGSPCSMPQTCSCLGRAFSCKALDFCLGKLMTQYLPKKAVEGLGSFTGWLPCFCGAERSKIHVQL